jgi:CopA family copper-resistance protein
MSDEARSFSRRELLRLLAAGGLLAGGLAFLPAYARPLANAAVTRRRWAGPVNMDLAIRRETVGIAGASAAATTINHSVPGPLVELYEGEEALLRVTNHLDEDSSIHWHGVLVPFPMDGVPGVVFPGIKPGETFEAHFRVRQSGTYWYHSHSGLQEQTGVYGPLIIHPQDAEPFAYDRDYVVMLSDWTFEDPYTVLAKLKKMSDYYNFHQRTVGDFFEDVNRDGLTATLRDRLAWGNMRMSPTDIADVTGYTYHYLMNGMDAAANWTGLFRPGERVRLRFINGSAMTYFNIRIPGLPMTVVQADGQNVEPVDTDELQIAVAETFDVIVRPPAESAYTIMAESMDRSGYTRGTLAPRAGMSAAVPPLREPPRRTMIDMGMAMDMNSMDMGTMGKMVPEQAGMAHGEHAMSAMDTGGQGGMKMVTAGPVVARHGPDDHGPGNIGIAEVERNRLGEPGTGLEHTGHRVLTYAQLRAVSPVTDKREPSRTIELHLTGNMERYMWSFDGKKYSEVKSPVHFPSGERIRLVLVNDTMMEHPIHLHGMFMELENGQGEHLPRKHTISVKPAERVSLLITADEPGRWAFHCHLLYHMKLGMFRVVEVS